MKKTILVTGATGKQGGSLARALLQRGHHVRALTRDPDSAAARALVAQGATLAPGDFATPATLVNAMQGADAVFAMTTPYEAGVEAEVAQGRALVDAARAAGAPWFVYTSVANADRATGIPHFDSKAAIERHLAASGVPSAVLAPVFFMDNLLAPWMLPGIQQGVLSLALPPGRRLQMVAVRDIGALATDMIERPDAFRGRRIDVASDELTPAEAAETLSRVTGHRVVFQSQPLEQVRQWSADFATMFEWFDRVGYSADVAGLRRDHPQVGWHSFEQWVQAQDWSVLGQPAAR